MCDRVGRWDADAVITLSLIHPACTLPFTTMRSSTAVVNSLVQPIILKPSRFAKVRFLAAELLDDEHFLKFDARISSKWVRWQKNRSEARQLRAVASILARTLNEQEVAHAAATAHEL